MASASGLLAVREEHAFYSQISLRGWESLYQPCYCSAIQHVQREPAALVLVEQRKLARYKPMQDMSPYRLP